MKHLKTINEYMLNKVMLCPDCDGRGYTNKGKCEICKGRGEYVWQEEEKFSKGDKVVCVDQKIKGINKGDSFTIKDIKKFQNDNLISFEEKTEQEWYPARYFTKDRGIMKKFNVSVK